MSESVFDVLFLSFVCTLLFGVAGVGILALPWKDDELADTTRAVRDAWRRLDDMLRAVGHELPRAIAHGATLRPVRRSARHGGPSMREAFHGRLGEAPTVAFEPPSMPA